MITLCFKYSGCNKQKIGEQLAILDGIYIKFHLICSRESSPQHQQINKKLEAKMVTSTPNIQGNLPSSSGKSMSAIDRPKKQQRNHDTDSPPTSPCVKAVVEKSNSVSFILDLNDTLPTNSSSLEFPPSPRLKHVTPTLTRKALQKSRSSSLEKKACSYRAKGTTSLAKCTSTGSFFNTESNTETTVEDKKGEEEENPQLNELSRRLHSTSESSGGADSENLESSIERVSPSGLSWTVPVNSSSPNSPRSLRHSSSRESFGLNLRHLHQPEEDEYEENLGDPDVYIDGLRQDIAPLVNLMNTSSSSPSDSELSRCGSQAGLTSESEEESSITDGDRGADSLSPVVEDTWTPPAGAGESMIPSDFIGSSGSASTNGSELGSRKETPNDCKWNEALSQFTATHLPPLSDSKPSQEIWSSDKMKSNPKMREIK